MRKFATPLIIALMAMTLAIAPACDVEIDWQDVAKKAVAEWVGSAIITGIDKYSGEATEKLVADWVLAQANDVAFLEPYLEYIDLERLIHAAWEKIWPKVYGVALSLGVDVDGDNDNLAWHVTPADFDGLVDELADMI